MTFGTLYGNVSESNGLYGIGQLIPGSTYFEWFIFKESVGQPATPTGGTWNFDTNIGIPPTGWSSTSPNIPVNPVWFCIAFVDSRNPTVIVWSTASKITAGSAAAAVDISFAPTGTLTSTNVQSAIAEVVTDLALSSGSSTVGYLPAGTGAVATTVQTKLRESVSVKDFGATGNGSTDDTAAIQLAVTAAYTNGKSLYFPAGTYLMSSTITMGNTTTTAATYCHFYGDGNNSLIQVTAANVNPFLWQGPNPDVDGAGNRITGRILIEKMRFLGPSSASSNTNSIGVKFYGVQGITLRDCTFAGWRDGEYYQNCDIVSRYNIYSQSNYNAVNSAATGYALTGAGQLNSFNTYGGLIANNTNYGVSYVGGLTPCFFGTNFVLNATSLVFSPNNVSGATVTASPIISGCYFEIDSATSIIFGGGNGIVRGGLIKGCNLLSASATPLITIANYSNALGRGLISNNTFDISFAGSSFITQASSAQKIDVNNLNATPIGDITPSTGVFTTVNSGLILKPAIASAGTVDILSIGSYAAVGSISMTITATATGVSTSRKYQIIIMGSGTVTGSDISFITEVYSGGGSAFSLSETANSPTAGTNKLTITNSSGATASYRIVYTVEDLTGTLTLL